MLIKFFLALKWEDLFKFKCKSPANIQTLVKDGFWKTIFMRPVNHVFDLVMLLMNKGINNI